MIENKKMSIATIIIRSIKAYFTTHPILIGAASIFEIIHGVSFGINVFFVEKFFSAMSALADQTGTFENAIKWTLLYGLALVFCRICNAYSNFIAYALSISKIQGKLFERINIKAGKLSLIAFENPSFLDDIKRANDGVEAVDKIASTVLNAFTFYGPYLVFMGFFYYSIYPMLALALLLAAVPPIFSQIFKIKFFTELADKQGPLKREFEYYEKCMCDREYYKETRLLGAYYYFKDIYKRVLGFFNKEFIQAQSKSLKAGLFADILSLIGYVLIICLIIRLIVTGHIGIGAFSAVFISTTQMIGIVMEIVNFRFTEISKQTGFAKNYFNFMDLPEKYGKNIEINDVPEITLENVTFTYPSAKSPSIENLNLHIRSGETIAIVGENGAGKSTLVKLIMGLYEPDQGTVSINDNDTKQISAHYLFKNTSAVFQNFQRYKMTLADNVSISDIDKIYTDGNKKSKNKTEKSRKDKKTDIHSERSIQQDKDINEAIKKADFEANSDIFTDGLDTMLSREFDGIDLSGGQWQSIAIARAFYKQHNMIILDEPTAAIDPVMETKIYNKFAQMSNGKTSIVVTHRLGSAKIADRIVVMDKGNIAEIGTHDELMKNNGKYSEMYSSQSKWYNSESL